MIALSALVALVLAIAACNFPQTVLQSSASTTPSSSTAAPGPPAGTLPPAPTANSVPQATGTAMPAPTPLREDLVWYGPNMGSRDFAELFTKPEQWDTARARIDVFQFFSQNLLDAPCSICGENKLYTFADAHAFETLKQWGIPIAMETGAVKEWGCTGVDEFAVTRDAIEGVRYDGGDVALLAMDEPYIGGELVANGISCHHTMEQSADATAKYVSLVKDAYPNIVVGDVEPYPYFSAAQLEDWTRALEARGATPAFFHIDVNPGEGGYLHDEASIAADLQELQAFYKEQGIAFGVIYTANLDFGVQTDQGYYDLTMEWLRQVQRAIGRPQHVIFESWLGPAPGGRHEVPINLPEDDPSVFSHTRLVLDGLEALGP
jgi:hypothetical protein